MTPRRILITGASGCVGHYLTDALMQKSDVELFLLLRNPGKLRLDPRGRPGITILPGDVRDAARYADLLRTVDVAVLAATAWGGPEVFDVNVTGTLNLLNGLDPAVCRQVLYFSTASILDRRHRALPEAGTLGTPYIQSKYECLRRLPDLAIAPRVTVLFPSLVLGGDGQNPSTPFLADALPRIVQWVDLIRFIRSGVGFHFIHARDIARVVSFLIDQPPQGDGPRLVVLGQRRYTIDQVVEEVCAYLGKSIYFRVPLPVSLANPLLTLFPHNVPPQDRAWVRYCLQIRDFTYENPTNPASFGLPNYCPTLTDFLRQAGVPRGRAVREAAGRLG